MLNVKIIVKIIPNMTGSLETKEANPLVNNEKNWLRKYTSGRATMTQYFILPM
ncbi:MAG: hypothetical protein WBX01_02985 [Nitrososphaeraceae archaeon]